MKYQARTAPGFLVPVILAFAATCLNTGCGLFGINVLPDITPPTVQFYTTPFLCEADAGGNLVQATAVVLHNPEAGQVTLYRRAVLVGREPDPDADILWNDVVLLGDQAVRIDCDEFARVISNDRSATFASEFGTGARVDGFMTIGIEAGGEVPRLDASVQFSQPGGGFTVSPMVPSLVTVDAWPPAIVSGTAP